MPEVKAFSFGILFIYLMLVPPPAGGAPSSRWCPRQPPTSLMPKTGLFFTCSTISGERNF